MDRKKYFLPELWVYNLEDNLLEIPKTGGWRKLKELFFI